MFKRLKQRKEVKARYRRIELLKRVDKAIEGGDSDFTHNPYDSIKSIMPRKRNLV